MRWQKIPAEQSAMIEAFVRSGKPVVGFRTTTHAFNYPKGDPQEPLNAFGNVTFGSPPGWGADGHTHYGHESSTDVEIIPSQEKNPILTGVDKKFHVRSWLYHVVPKYPPADAVRLLEGTAVKPDKPAVPNPVAWTWTNRFGGKVFMTTMGHPEDFDQEPLQRLVVNAIHWSLGKKVPKEWAGPLDIHVPYEGFSKSPVARSH
jgi:type 1 glutamine amidotransferase